MELVCPAREIAKTFETHAFLWSQVFFNHSGVVLLEMLNIEEVNISIVVARCKTGVVFEPFYAVYSGRVTLELHVLWALSSVEVVHFDRVIKGAARKQMSAVAKSDFFTPLNSQSIEFLQAIGKNIKKLDFVHHSDNDVEATWMERNSLSIFASADLSAHFEGLCCVVPNVDVVL